MVVTSCAPDVGQNYQEAIILLDIHVSGLANKRCSEWRWQLGNKTVPDLGYLHRTLRNVLCFSIFKC